MKWQFDSTQTCGNLVNNKICLLNKTISWYKNVLHIDCPCLPDVTSFKTYDNAVLVATSVNNSRNVALWKNCVEEASARKQG